jgi:hypothetical protein
VVLQQIKKIQMRFDNVWRLSTAQALAVASVGGAAASSAAFGTQTYAIQVAYAIVSPNDNAVSSTAGNCHRTG